MDCVNCSRIGQFNAHVNRGQFENSLSYCVNACKLRRSERAIKLIYHRTGMVVHHLLLKWSMTLVGRRIHLNTVDSCEPSILWSWVQIWTYACSIYSQIVGTTYILHCVEKRRKLTKRCRVWPIFKKSPPHIAVTWTFFQDEVTLRSLKQIDCILYNHITLLSLATVYVSNIQLTKWQLIYFRKSQFSIISCFWRRRSITIFSQPWKTLTFGS